MEQEEVETKPIVENKSSIEILSELFSTFDAAPPILIEDELLSNDSKKHKKKKKNKDKKHKKKSKKRKRSRSSSSSSSSELEFDLAKLLVKQEQSEAKKIKIEGTDLSLNLDNIHEKEQEEDVDIKPSKIILEKAKENEEGEISSDDGSKNHSKHKSKHKHKKSKSKERVRKHSDKVPEDNVSKSKSHHRSHRSKDKDDSDDFYKNKDSFGSRTKHHKHSDLRYKIKDSKRSNSIHEDNGSSPLRYSDSHYGEGSTSKQNRRYNSCDDDFYKSRDRDWSFDRSRKDDFYGTRNNDRSRDDKWHRSRDYRDHKFRDRRYDSDKEYSHIDKKKLLEIARKNAIQMMKSGSLPGALSLGPQAQEKVIAAIRAGGKTIEELTDFCKTLASKEDLGELSDVEEEKGNADSDNDVPFNHPFQIKDRPTTITMNIKNSVPLPLKTTQERTTELSMQFPVSSGQHHRKNENEWVPVEAKKDPPRAPKASITLTKEVVPITPLIPPVESAPILSTVSAVNTVQEQIDIGAIVSQRLTAMRKLQENPHDVQALSQMYQSSKEVQSWAESKQQTGQFTGAIGAKFLSHSELTSGYQAWAKKDQLQSAAPVSGGMGMHLLQKMGWKPGEGLGKEKTGALEPLLLEVKLDKRGLVATDESQRKKKGRQVQKPPQNPNGKHPVSLLGEYACKNKLGAPTYDLCFECGPDHKKNFLFKVTLNGMEFQPNVASPNKKEAKANAAMLCLQKLGIVPQ